MKQVKIKNRLKYGLSNLKFKKSKFQKKKE